MKLSPHFFHEIPRLEYFCIKFNFDFQFGKTGQSNLMRFLNSEDPVMQFWFLIWCNSRTMIPRDFWHRNKLITKSWDQNINSLWNEAGAYYKTESPELSSKFNLRNTTSLSNKQIHCVIVHALVVIKQQLWTSDFCVLTRYWWWPTGCIHFLA